MPLSWHDYVSYYILAALLFSCVLMYINQQNTVTREEFFPLGAFTNAAYGTLGFIFLKPSFVQWTNVLSILFVVATFWIVFDGIKNRRHIRSWIILFGIFVLAPISGRIFLYATSELAEGISYFSAVTDTLQWVMGVLTFGLSG